jgi:catechol 2,3-dioxygenase-like lactoylglutathione lyase family enzyme
MIKPKFGFVVEYVPDIQAAKRFYVDVLGLDVEREHPTFVQFSHFAIANDESLSGSRGPEVYWLVDDAAAAFTELSQRADVTLPLTQRPYGRVFGIAEPSGTPRYLLELARERPSRPVQ